MIQPNELRPNNLVYLNSPLGDDKRIVRVTGVITKDKINTEDQIWYQGKDCVGSTKLDYINPIPLTEDVLLKCKGVVKEREDDKYGRVYLVSNTKYIIRIVNFGNPLKEDFGFSLEISDDIDWCSIKRIYTLHDFQNTIYQLTNQELEIEL